jgi:hypothetical protein
MWNGLTQVTEATTANVVEKAGQLMTPPVECVVLAGTIRGAFSQGDRRSRDDRQPGSSGSILACQFGARVVSGRLEDRLQAP